ncbi:MAG: hypothetical protein KDA37_07735 [Planctomycetales bacterium]|nr:hypothetical protein [Planctomycetales bacterium]
MESVAKASIALGVILLLAGAADWYFSAASAPGPVEVDLAALESGATIDGVQLQIGAHGEVMTGAVFTFKRGLGNPGGAVAADTRIQSLYYPILSESHPFMNAKGKSNRSLESFSMIVKTDRYRGREAGKLPRFLTYSSGVKGMVIGKGSQLPEPVRASFKQSFRLFNIDSVVVIEEDREPLPTRGFAITVVGAVLTGFGLLMFRGDSPDAKWERGED